MTILQVQLLLRYLGYNPGVADGIFGGNTRAAVLAFQGNAKIRQDGIPGPNTYAALKKAVANDDFKSKHSAPVSSTVTTTNPASGSAKPFNPRLSRPEAGNPYYNTRARGGYSDAITGSPQDAGCNVLCNCVGYAYGRFNEIAGLGYCKYLRPVNAENFIQNRGNLSYGQEPKVGGCMVWQKGATLAGSDGAGHVAIVEKVNSDGSIVTSESGWGGPVFTTKVRSKGDGNWGAGGAYSYIGCIYQP